MTRAALAIVSVMLAACDSEAALAPDAAPPDAGEPDAAAVPEDVPRRLCDGGSHLAVFGRVWSFDDIVSVGEAFLSENGHLILIVRGDCTYVVSEGGSQEELRSGVLDLRHGVLDREAEEELADALSYDAWPRIAGGWSSPGDDSSFWTSVVEDADYMIACHGGCEAPDTPPEVIRLDDLYHPLIRDLWSRGERGDGPLRIKLVRDFTGIVPAVDWPLDIPLSSLILEYEEADSVVSTLVEGERAAALRAIWQPYLDGEHGDWDGYVGINDPPREPVRLYLREVLPFEDATGRVTVR
jgi:hypothetical protein